MKLQRLLKSNDILWRALNFAERRGILTYDPGDFKGTSLLIWTFKNPTLLKRMIRSGVYCIAFVFPNMIRKVLKVTPMATPHGIAALSMVYSNLARIYTKEAYALRAQMLLKYLADIHAEANEGIAWGLPFAWYSSTLLPPNIGNSHTTVWGGNAFLDYFYLTNDKWSLNYAINAGIFLTKCLNVLERPSGSVALSYTHLDHNQVINTNADIASFILKVSKASKLTHFYDLARRITTFVLETQNNDGSWYYFAPDAYNRVSVIDGYHTGMVLKALMEIDLNLAEEDSLRTECRKAIIRGLQYYIKNLITREGIAKFQANRTFPIDIYAYAQAVLTLTTAANYCGLEPSMKFILVETLHKVVDSAISLMFNPSGSFKYRKYKIGSINLYSLRWAQSVMCLALTHYIDLLYTKIQFC